MYRRMGMVLMLGVVATLGCGAADETKPESSGGNSANVNEVTFEVSEMT